MTDCFFFKYDHNQIESVIPREMLEKKLADGRMSKEGLHFRPVEICEASARAYKTREWKKWH